MKLVWLDQPICQNPALAGGKAANLSRLSERHPVPPGFCLTVEAIPPLSGPLYAELAAAYHQLANRCGLDTPPVAVRSSAVGEDGAATSFAGVYETSLNVSGLEAVAEAVRQCWASARSPRALAYRREQGLPEDQPGLAVIVQQLIPADSSLVAFSANPVSGERAEIVINAVWGLGEGLVGGQMTPDVYTVRKADLSLVAAQVAPKQRMVVQAAAGGVQTAEVPQPQQSQPTLDNNQVVEVARLVIDLERELGWPVDVEAAYQAGRLHLLQCRPITTLAEPAVEPMTAIDPALLDWDRPEETGLTWFGGGEPVKPLQQSLSLYYYQGWAKAFADLKVKGGLRARFVHGYEYRLWTFEPAVSWSEFDLIQSEAERRLPHRWAQEWLPQIQADLEAWRAVDLQALAGDELAVHLHDMLSRQLRHWEIHAHMGSLPLRAVQRLIDWYLARFPSAPESEPYRLLQGQSNSSVENNHLLWELSRMVTPEIAAALEASAWERLPDAFRQAFEVYLARFFYAPPERRRQAAVLIMSYAAGDAPDPFLEVERLAAERAAFTAEVRMKLDAEERATFEALLDCALANNPLTETHAFWLDGQSNAATHRVTDEFARRLVEAGSLDQAGDVAYLSLYDLMQWGFGLSNPLRPLVARRRADHEANQRLSPPPFIGAPPAPPEPDGWVDRFSGPPAPLEAGAGQLRGIGASAGVVRGPARVVLSLEEALALQRGEILVCPATDPNWTPLFAIAAALVTDSGGSLAHAAVVAREYRLPAVAGAHTATQKIRNGQLIEVDGLNGLVRLL
jgi:pyruvate,water dikinase